LNGITEPETSGFVWLDLLSFFLGTRYRPWHKVLLLDDILVVE